MQNDLITRWSCKKADRCNFNVMVLYDELAAGQRAMQLVSALAEKLEERFDFRPQLWRFDLVVHPDWREFIDADASRADLFMISTGDGTELPPGVRDWLDVCLRRKQGGGAALVALVGRSGELEVSTSPGLQFLRNLAKRNALEFFLPASQAGRARHSGSAGVPTWRAGPSAGRREITVCQGGEGASLQALPPFNKTPPNYYWGLNE